MRKVVAAFILIAALLFLMGGSLPAGPMDNATDVPDHAYPYKYSATNTIQVGPTRAYKTLAAGIAAASYGSTIEVDAGTYTDESTTINKNNIMIRGVGGKAHYRWVTGNLPNDKAVILVNGNNIVIHNVEVSGAVSASGDASGIRIEPNANTTISNCYLHHNQNGILTSNDKTSTLTVRNTELYSNGYDSDPATHNIYVGHIASLNFEYNYSHGAHFGHDLKTRARFNWIAYNRIMDESSGNASYIIDVPNGGETYIIGNLLHKGPSAENYDIVSYAAESALGGRLQALYVINNTLVSDFGDKTRFVFARPGTNPFFLTNNIFVGAGTISAGASPALTTNLSSHSDPGFVSISKYDYRLRSSANRAIDAGRNPGTSNTGVSLLPAYQYAHPLGSSMRTIKGKAIDIGAYECMEPVRSR